MPDAEVIIALAVVFVAELAVLTVQQRMIGEKIDHAAANAGRESSL